MIEAPVEVVFAFHEHEEALALLSPPFPPVKITRRGGIEIGARVEMRTGPIRWVARHTDFERNRLFVDELIDGPILLWVHRHEFEDLGGRTRLTDRIEYRSGYGPFVNLLMRAMLWILFRYRHRVTRRECERR